MSGNEREITAYCQQINKYPNGLEGHGRFL
jgi:hypothetical protein